MESSVIQELRKIAKETIVAIGLLSATVTLKNEYVKQEKKSTLKEQAQAILAKSEEDAKKVTSQQIANNFNQKLNIVNIKNSFAKVDEAGKEETALRQSIAERRHTVD